MLRGFKAATWSSSFATLRQQLFLYAKPTCFRADVPPPPSSRFRLAHLCSQRTSRNLSRKETFRKSKRSFKPSSCIRPSSMLPSFPITSSLHLPHHFTCAVAEPTSSLMHTSLQGAFTLPAHSQQTLRSSSQIQPEDSWVANPPVRQNPAANQTKQLIHHT